MDRPGRQRARQDSSDAARQAMPTSALPGSAEKIEVLARRAARREQMHVAGDVLEDTGRALHWEQRGNGVFVAAATREVRAEPGDAGPGPISFGDRLRQLRLEAGLLLRHLARRSGVSSACLSRLENGDRLPSIGTLISLAVALDCSLDELVGRYRR